MDINRLLKSTGIVVSILLTACAWSGKGNQPASPDKADSIPISLLDGGLLVSWAGKPELGLELANTSSRRLWVNVHFQTPEGLNDCMATKELEPQANGIYICPQSSVQADTDYPIDISIYSDLEQTRLEGTTTTNFRFSQADIKTLNSTVH
jgi:hypothetical protein